MRNRIAASVAAVVLPFTFAAAWASTATAANHRSAVKASIVPEGGDDTFCVSNGDVSFTLAHTNRKGLAWFLRKHEGFELLHKGACVETPPPGDEGGGTSTTPPPVPVVPEEVVIPSGPSETYLCTSRFTDPKTGKGALPSAVAFDAILPWLREGDFTPMAKPGGTPGNGDIVLPDAQGHFYTLYCNFLAGTKGLGIGIGDGTSYDPLAWVNVLITYGPMHLNHYERSA